MNNKMKNDEILAILAENNIELTATPVIIDIVETKNPEYKAVFMIAEIKMKAQNSSLSKAQIRLKGWSSSSMILRSIESVSKEAAEELEIGMVLEDTTFRVIDELSPSHDRHNPRQNKKGELLLDELGQMVFRSAYIIDVEELEEIGHKTISVKAQVAKVEEKTTKSEAMTGLGGKKPSTTKLPVKKKSLLNA